MSTTTLRGAEVGNTPEGMADAPHFDAGTIDHDRPCAVCGYNLKGLARGGRCPECGSAIRVAQLNVDRLGDAPVGYIKLLLTGYICMIFGGTFSFLAAVFSFAAPDLVAASLGAFAGTLWLVGVGITALPRRRALPERLQGYENESWLKLRIAMVATQAFLPLAFVGGYLFGAAVMTYTLVPVLLGAVALGFYQGKLAQWAEDDSLHHRWTGTGIVVAASFAFMFGIDQLHTLLIALFGTSSGLVNAVRLVMILTGFVCTLFFIVSLVWLVIQPCFSWHMVNWARRNALEEVERESRRQERWRQRADELTRPTATSDPSGYASIADAHHMPRRQRPGGVDDAARVTAVDDIMFHASAESDDDGITIGLPPRDRPAAGPSSSPPARPERPVAPAAHHHHTDDAQASTHHRAGQRPTTPARAPAPALPATPIADPPDRDLNPYELESD